jgi:peptidoglycan/xylan/chitin deacetylase (PgdA/CDA1 family)
MSDVLVLCYHAVSESWRAPLSVAPRRLESQLSLLVERGYKGATFYEAVNSPPGPKAMAVTFDDAYRSVLQLAHPILERLGLVGTIFVPTACASTSAPMKWPGIDHWLGGPHEHELTPLSWDELEYLSERGWEIGSHSRTHPHLTELPDRELLGELRGSREECEARLGRPCRSIAYPYGSADDRVACAAREAGYLAGAALPDRFDGGSPLLRPRVGVYRKDGLRRFRLKVSPTVRALRASRAWGLVSTIRARGETSLEA